MKQFKYQSLAGTFMVTPWMSEEEFKLVASRVCSSNLDDLKVAQERLSVWKVRQGRRFQDIFDVTLCILSDILSINGAKGDTCQQVMLNSASLTIVRFVSLMTEGSLKDKVERSSVLELSTQIGIPEWIVDMRHQAVHSILPADNFVLKALLFAKDYVYERFWSLEANDVYVENSEKIKDRLRNVLRDQSIHADERKDAILKFLSPLKYPAYSTILQEIIGYFVHLSKSLPFSDDKRPPLSAAMKLSAKPVVEAVRKAGFLDQLVECLLLDERCSNVNVCWLLHIIASFYNTEEERLRIQTEVVDKCLLDSSLSSTLSQIYPLFGEDENLKELLLIYNKESRVDGEVSWTLRDVSDLTCQGGGGVTPPDVQGDVSSSPWTLSADVDWTNTPLGMLPSRLSCSPMTADEMLSSPVHEQEVEEDNSIIEPASPLSAAGWSEGELEEVKANIVVI